MQGRQVEGIAFMNDSSQYWASSYFAVHNWWHEALYHLELQDIDRVLSLYDGPIRGARSTEWLDLVDAASLLWRVSLFVGDIDERVHELAADIESVVGDPVYIFNDWHVVMVFGMAGRHEFSEQVLTSNRRRASGTNRVVAEQVGLTLLEGFSSFSAGRNDRAFDLLTHAKPFVSAVGGSNAQRDVIELTLIAAASRAGHEKTARALAAERVATRPSSAAATEQLLRVNGC
jgi:hypothetical protein